MFQIDKKEEDFNYNSCRFCLDTLYDKETFDITQEVQNAFENLTNIKLNISQLLPNKMCQECILEISRCSAAKFKFTKNQEWLQDTFLQFTEERDLQSKIKTEPIEIGEIMNIEVLDHNAESTVLEECIVKSEYEIMSYDQAKYTDSESILSNTCSSDPIKNSTELMSHLTHRYFCDLCPFKHYSKDELLDHMRTHLNCKDIKCTTCDEMFNSKSAMVNHNYVVHLKKFLVTCVICSRIFNTIFSYKNHMKFVHTLEVPFVCNVIGCAKAYSSRNHLAKHKRMDHSKPGTCPICSKFFNSQLTLKQHIKRHNRHLKCDKCQRKFSCNYTLKKHSKTHEDVREFACPHCARKYFGQGSLNNHIRSTHLEIKYCCVVPGCGAIIKGKSGVKNHIIRRHKEIEQDQLKDILENIKSIPNPNPDLFEVQLPEIQSNLPPVPPLIYYT